MEQHPLRAYRKRTGISLDELALKTGASKATLSRLENGKQVPSLGLIGRLNEATKGALTANDFMPDAPAHLTASEAA